MRESMSGKSHLSGQDPRLYFLQISLPVVT